MAPAPEPVAETPAEAPAEEAVAVAGEAEEAEIAGGEE